MMGFRSTLHDCTVAFFVLLNRDYMDKMNIWYEQNVRKYGLSLAVPMVNIGSVALIGGQTQNRY